MKKLITSLFCLSLILTFAGCASSHENTAMKYYDKHIAEFKDNIGCHYEKGDPLSFPSRGVTVNEWNGEHTVVEYIVTGTGSFSSPYSGFFYSKDNVPVSFQNSGEDLIEISDTEWEWHGEGDNHGYVRQIEPYWFYFDASF